MNIKILFLLMLFITKLNAQNSKQNVRITIEDLILSIDPNEQLKDLKSIYYEGKLLNNDTSNIKIFKYLPHSFKSHTYNEIDSIISIVSEEGYYQYRNGHAFSTERSDFDQPIYDDLVKFNLYYALIKTYKSARIKFLQENDSIVIFQYSFKAGQLYTFKLDKETNRIIEYSCDCLKINDQKGYVRLKNYKSYNSLFFPTRVELWSESKLEEVFEYDSISINNLQKNNFGIE